MSKRAEKIAAKIVGDIMLESVRLDKSCGTRDEIISTVMPIAEAIVVLDKSIGKRRKKVDEWAETDSKFLAMVEGNAGVDPHLHPFSDIIPPEKVVKMRTDHTVTRQLKTIDDTLRDV
jgi:hypothetical protein